MELLKDSNRMILIECPHINHFYPGELLRCRVCLSPVPFSLLDMQCRDWIAYRVTGKTCLCHEKNCSKNWPSWWITGKPRVKKADKELHPVFRLPHHPDQSLRNAIAKKNLKKNCCFSFFCLYWALTHTPGDQNDQKSEPRDVFFNQGLNPSLNSSPYWRLKLGPPTCCTSTKLQPSFNPLKLWPLKSLSPLHVPTSIWVGSKGESTSVSRCS